MRTWPSRRKIAPARTVNRWRGATSKVSIRRPAGPSLPIVAAVREQAELSRPSGAARRRVEAEVAEGLRGEEPAARRPLDEPLLDQERLDDVLDRVARLADRGGDRLDADRPAAEAFGDQRQVAAVEG